VTGCPALTTVNASSEKRIDELQDEGEVILITNYEGTGIKIIMMCRDE